MSRVTSSPSSNPVPSTSRHRTASGPFTSEGAISAETAQPTSPHSQPRLFEAYAVVHDAHRRATDLLAEALTVFAVHFAQLEDNNNNNNNGSSSSSTHGSAPRSALPIPPEQFQAMVEDLLLQLTDMQTALSPHSNADPSGVEVADAVCCLEKYLPSDWREALPSSWTISPLHAKDKHKTTLPQSPPSQQQQQQRRSKNHNGDLNSGGDSSSSHAHANASASDVLSYPADVVQLGLVLRRHWTLQRDVALVVPALMDVLRVMSLEPQRGDRNTYDRRCSGSEAAAGDGNATSRSARARASLSGSLYASPSLSVSVALAVLQLTHAQGTFETQRASSAKTGKGSSGHWSGAPNTVAEDLTTITTSATTTTSTTGEEYLLPSYAHPLVASASSTALTLLPFLLWRTWVEESDREAEEGVEGTATTKTHVQQQQQEQQHENDKQQETSVDRNGVSSEQGATGEVDKVLLRRTSAAATAHGCATARTLTKHVFKWEAHMAAYVSAQLHALENTPSPSSQRRLSSASANQESSGRSAFMTESDVAFLVSVQLELNALRGACNAAQLLWLTIYAVLHPLPASGSVRAQHAAAQKDVKKRCTKLERQLRALFTMTITAPLLLPGVLLWLGYFADVAAHGVDSSAASLSPDCVVYWQEAHTRGAEVLGPLHPFVEAMTQLLPPPTPTPYTAQKHLSITEGHDHTARQQQGGTEVNVPTSAAAAAYRASTPLIPTQLPTRPPPAPPFSSRRPSPPFAVQAPLPSSPLSSALPPVAHPQPPPQQQQQQLPLLPPQRSYPNSSARLHPSPPPPRTPTDASTTTHATAQKEVVAATSLRPPDITRAFTTAFSPPQQSLSGHQSAFAATAGPFSASYTPGRLAGLPSASQRAPAPLPILRAARAPPGLKLHRASPAAANVLRNTFPPPRASQTSDGENADRAGLHQDGVAAFPHAAAAAEGAVEPTTADGERVDAAKGTGAEDGVAAASKSPQPPRTTRGIGHRGKTRVNGLAAVRNCHRLGNPADAFQLTSTVRDAVYDDDLAHRAKMARRGRGGGGAGRRRKKGKGRDSKTADATASTEALLLSADAETSSSTLNETGTTGANGEHAWQNSSSTSHHHRQPRQRRKRPDRQLLPPLPEARRGVESDDVCSPLPSNPVDVPSPSHAPLSPFARADEPFWRGSIHGDSTGQHNNNSNNNNSSSVDGKDDSARRSIINTTASQSGNTRPRRSRSNSQRNKKKDSRRSDVFPFERNQNESDADVVKSSEDEEDEDEEDLEDDYDVETLPERNARLQREVRTYFLQLNERRVHAAAVIQRAWRCSRARRTLQARQQMLYRYVYIIQKAACLAVEGFVRCVWAQRARRTALAQRAADDAQRCAHEQKQIAAAKVLTRAARQWGIRQRERRRLRDELNLARDARLKQYEVTSVTVQRWWRAIQPIKAYWRRRTAEVVAERQRQAEAARIAQAATVIQSRVRGVQARTRVSALRRTRAAEAHAAQLRRDAAVTALTTVLQEFVLRQARQTREAALQATLHESAAVRIAESWQAAMARRRLDVAVHRARQLRTAATTVQRAWRRYVAGRQRRYLRQTRRTLTELRLAKERAVADAVVLLQSAARGALAVVLVRQLRARRGRTFMESVVYLQAVGRAMRTREMLGQARLDAQARHRAAAAALAARQMQSASLAQALLRAALSSHLVQHRRRDTLREKVHVYTAAAGEMRRDGAATVIQQAVRRHQQRRRAAAAAAEAAVALQYLHENAACVQRAWRCFAARQQRRQRAAAVARAARKRQQQEEVFELIWHDQKRELDVLCSLEQHYVAEAEHAARMALYRVWRSLSSMTSAEAVCGAGEPLSTRLDGKGEEDPVGHWASLYVD